MKKILSFIYWVFGKKSNLKTLKDVKSGEYINIEWINGEYSIGTVRCLNNEPNIKI